ncbi:hypothetical protein TPA0905_75660 [Streptomyces olivaceus]|nr:hypothetical protein TPA0905_75660 [Streptomyces olivaceus]
MGAPLDPALRAGCRERRRRAAAPATAARPSPAGAGPRARRAAGPAALARPSPTATPELPGGRGGGVPPPRPGGHTVAGASCSLAASRSWSASMSAARSER